MKKLTKIILLILISLLIIPVSITKAQEENEETKELTPEEELKLHIENYETMVKNNAGWNEKYEVIKSIRSYLDSNVHIPKAYEIIVKWFYINGPLRLCKKYGQKAVDISAKLDQIVFTRDTIFYMGLLYMKKTYLDYGKALGYFNIVNGMGKDIYTAKSELLHQMGICYKELHSVREDENDTRYIYLAEAAFEFAVFLENNIENRYQLGQTYEKLGKYKKAVESYEIGLEINPNYEKIILAKKQLENKMNESN